MCKGAVTLMAPDGSARALSTACSISSASCKSRSARSCKSRPSDVSVSERVVRVKSGPPSGSSSLRTFLLMADGETERARAAAVQLPSDAAGANAISRVSLSNPIYAIGAQVKRPHAELPSAVSLDRVKPCLPYVRPATRHALHTRYRRMRL
jgi:hypothetical protein